MQNAFYNNFGIYTWSILLDITDSDIVLNVQYANYTAYVCWDLMFSHFVTDKNFDTKFHAIEKF